MPDDQAPPKKLLEQNIVWFAIGMVAAGALGAIAFLDKRIDDRIANTPDLITKVAGALARDHEQELRGAPPTKEDIQSVVQQAIGDLAGLPVDAVVAFDSKAPMNARSSSPSSPKGRRS